MMQPEEPCLDAGIHSGLDAIRTLHQMGYGEYRPNEVPNLQFPVEAVVKQMFLRASQAFG